MFLTPGSRAGRKRAVSGGSGTPGGSTLQIQYNNASAFAGMSGTSWDDTNRALTMAGPTSGTGAIISIPATTSAILQHGAVDAASPVAQTLQVQSVIAGTTNTAGADWTLQGSLGTGTGAGGNIIFKAAPIGSTGSTQNAAVEVGRFGPSGNTTNKGLLTVGNAAFADAQYPKIFMPNTSGSVYLGSYFGTLALSNALSSGQMTTGMRCGPLHIALQSTGELGWASSTGAIASGGDGTAFTRAATAAIQIGQADIAAPLAQTLQAQSVVAGTSNTAGQNWTIKGSKGTGTGAGGNIVFQAAAAGTTGTAQNAATTVFTVRADQTVQMASFTVATLPATGTAGRMAYVTDATAPTYLGTLTGGGAVKTPVFDNGTAWVSF